MHEINASFPKIDNLEYFPLHILLNIFDHCTDASLPNLAENSSRFDGIARMVLAQRYAAQYFVIDDGQTESQRQLYWTLFEKICRHVDISAIAAKRVLDIDANENWMAQLLRTHINHLEKLSFDECSFRNSHEFFSQYMNLTDLTLRYIHRSEDIPIQLPEFGSLKKLELSRVSSTIPAGTIERIISNNPALESLVLRHLNYERYAGLFEAIANHLKNLKELVLITNTAVVLVPTLLSHPIVERFINALQHVESLGLTIEGKTNGEVHTHSMELFDQVGRACKQLKHLELKIRDFAGIRTELIETIVRLDRLESLALETESYDSDAVKTMLEYLPSLRQLYIKFDEPNSYVDNLLWLKRYPLIERIVLAIDNFNSSEADSAFIGNMRYFMKLQGIIQGRSVRIEFEENLQVIGRITQDEIVWRNKLMQWTGHSLTQNASTTTSLLHMADVIPEATLPNPFDLILDYLDLGSLNALAMTCKHIRQLIERYAERRSQEHASFSISNEFAYENESPQLFARHVTNLSVYNYDWSRRDIPLVGLVQNAYLMVTKLRIMHDRMSDQRVWMFPEIQHLVCNSFKSYFALQEIDKVCPHLEILECEKPISAPLYYGPTPFRRLQQFIFKYSDDAILTMVQQFFRNTNVVLVPRT